jgi:hypothetical protein
MIYKTIEQKYIEDDLYRVFEIRRTVGGRFSAGPTEASYLAVLLSTKHFLAVLYVMALPNMSRGYKYRILFFLEIDFIAFKQFPLVRTSFKFYIW